ncbi:MAG TPA: indolepyruvate ferredoxin oxidoreductase subunit alpha [candidate division Zixibacteria bacterium]|nr:indolepyruvate ferredoxin oxidoreductase subunit alpha [candidate division Zixibacteria bacterium]
MKMLLSGNEAVARGAWEAGVRIASAYPGTPSTEILETIAMLVKDDIYAEWSPNEKVAFEVAIGGSMAGARSLVCMKHVGLNVAADPFMTYSYTGVKGGFVVVSADDPSMHSSQNEQDNRFYAKFAIIPMLEPSDSQESKDLLIEAYDISEQFDTPVLFRMVTRISHSKGVVQMGDRKEHEPEGFERDIPKYVMVPGHARLRRKVVLERLEKLKEFAEETPLNRWENGGKEIGIISSGISYVYAKEVMPDASYLKLGLSYPLPEKKIREFAKSVDRLFIIEELEPFLEEQIKAMGIQCEGKEHFTNYGELSPGEVMNGFVHAGILSEGVEKSYPAEQLFPRPPVLCPGCPHRGIFTALKKMKVPVTGDIGCYTLAALKPLEVMDSCICMGASIGNAIGMAKAGTEKKGVVAAIGDSTFLHSGITGVLDAVYNKANVVILILDNRITAMTGGQHHPGTGVTLMGEETFRVDFVELCKTLGVRDIHTVDAYDLDASKKVLKAALQYEGPSVVITSRPCALMPNKIKEKPYVVLLDECNGCKLCFRIGCPAIFASEEKTEKGHNKAIIDPNQCTGCTICAQVCPKDCIVRVDSPVVEGART